MSMKAVVWALHQPDLTPSQKIVLLMLSDRHNPDLGCFPSIKRMSKDCNMSRSSIFAHLTVLEKKGLIERKGRCREDGQQTSNEYYLNIDNGVQNIDAGGAKSGLSPIQNLDTNNHVSINHVNKPILRSNSIGFDNFWAIYHRKVGRANAEKAFSKASHAVGVDKILDAVKPYADSVSHKEKKFIPHPATWLNQGRWDDELEKQEHGIDHLFRDMVNDLARVRITSDE